jgi:Bax protein
LRLNKTIYTTGALLALFAFGMSHNSSDVDPYLYKVSITESNKVVSAKAAPEHKDAHRVSVKSRTGAFFAMLHPHVLKTNKKIWKERNHLLQLKGNHEAGHKLSYFDREWLKNLAVRYKVKHFDVAKSAHWESLLDRVDIVPAALALAQAATESGYGESRMARLGNNLFGHSCFSPGCGIAPLGQKEGTPYELSKFASVKEAVESYVKNINTHRAYRHIRAERKRMRTSNIEPTGLRLAQGLKAYSERGDAYISDIGAMIRINRLERFASL